MKKKNEVVVGKNLSIIDQYILEEARLLRLQIANLRRFKDTLYDASYILKKRKTMQGK